MANHNFMRSLPNFYVKIMEALYTKLDLHFSFYVSINNLVTGKSFVSARFVKE